MKYVTLSTNPKGFASALEKAKTLLSSGDAEVTLALAGGKYHLTCPVALDARDYKGESRLRIVGGGRQKAVFSALKELPAEDFMPVEGQP